jgi:hypothetical protein
VITQAMMEAREFEKKRINEVCKESESYPRVLKVDHFFFFLIDHFTTET